MFNFLGKKKEINDSNFKKRLEEITKEMAEIVTKHGKEENMGVIHIVSMPLEDNKERAEMSAVLSGNANNFLEIFKNIAEKDESLAKVMITVATYLKMTNPSLRNLENQLLDDSEDLGIKGIKDMIGRDGITIQDMENMSEEEMEEIVKKIVNSKRN